MKNSWNGKKKAVTFSFDDGVKQDIRLIEIFNKYGLKCTFNLNSELLGDSFFVERNGRSSLREKIEPEKVKEIYDGHEVAVHTLTHPNLTTLSQEEIIRQVEEDRKKLSELCGYEVVGMAYPCGGVNNDERVAKIIRENTGVKYARTITSTHNFDLQTNLFRFNPTVHNLEENAEELIEKFLLTESEEPRLFYYWGHSYEFDEYDGAWERIERICKKLSGRSDVFYGTNEEVLL